MSVGEFCNREVVVADRETTILEAAKLMRWHHVGDVIVTEARDNQQVPVGILTDRDIVVELLAEEIDLSMLCVGDAMSFELLIANESDDLLDAVERMRDRGVRRVPVVNAEGGLAGILTLDDMLEVFAEQLSDMVRLVSNEHHVERERRV
ncbi:MAG: CBS domain-containing protein [Desulfuromonadales bacterium]|nr:CBS domain-containing protein [Desulfuromonadales bacterium]NIR33198.1 CBS domain-containing protein [Desulfuromonadales bacterium]NIS41984.1 CBS domain-containing protein [Desulfuromonadales bacterium]